MSTRLFLSEQVKPVELDAWEKLFISKRQTKAKAETKLDVANSGNSFLSFISVHRIKLIDSMLSRIFKVVNNKETSKCGKNANDTLAFGLCASSFLFLPNFDVACDLLL